MNAPEPYPPDVLDRWRREIAEMPYEPPVILDLSTPVLARGYNYALGGKDHFEVDRHAWPEQRRWFRGLTLVPPGLVHINDWRPDDDTEQDGLWHTFACGAIAREAMTERAPNQQQAIVELTPRRRRATVAVSPGHG